MFDLQMLVETNDRSPMVVSDSSILMVLLLSSTWGCSTWGNRGSFKHEGMLPTQRCTGIIDQAVAYKYAVGIDIPENDSSMVQSWCQNVAHSPANLSNISKTSVVPTKAATPKSSNDFPAQPQPGRFFAAIFIRKYAKQQPSKQGQVTVTSSTKPFKCENWSAIISSLPRA